jgi:pilus assembly protein CpaE
MTIKVSAISNSEANLKVFADSTVVVGDTEYYPHIGSTDMLDNVVITDKPDVLVIDASVGADLNILQQIESALAKFPQIHTILISPDQSVEYLTLAMHIGVRKVLASPVDALSFQEALRLAQSRMAAAALASAAFKGGLVIAMVGAKGGSGVTFLATNLAYALARQNKRVAVLDLRLSFGDAAIYLGNTGAKTNLAELAQQYLRVDEAMLEASMAKVSERVHVLVAPATPELAAEVTPVAIEKIIEVARRHYDFVVMDVSSTLDPVALKAINLANLVYLVVQLDIPNVRAAKSMGQYLRGHGCAPEKIQIVVNSYQRGAHFGLEDVEKSTLARVARTIPSSPAAVADSVNQGIPLVEITPRDPVARALREWAENLAPLDGNGHKNGRTNGNGWHTGNGSHTGNGNGNGNGNGRGGPMGMLRRFMGFGQ